MPQDRLTFALDRGALTLPDQGRIVAIGLPGDADLSALPLDRLDVLQTFRPDADALTRRGVSCGLSADGPFAAAIVTVPRARDLALARIAQAASLAPQGLVIVDGAKTDGIDSILRQLRQRTELLGQISKMHGRVLWFKADTDLSDWAAKPRQIAGGFITTPGVFSADAPDPASVGLAAALPAKLGRAVADLGAGWGYLSAQILDNPGVETLYLVEAEASSLNCAKNNLNDPRLRFDWADATTWTSPELLDTVVMNPPFHTGRTGDPALGQAFILNAARNLKPSGQLWMVANRHLPYEAIIAQSFRKVTELGGPAGFKIVNASHPTLRKR